MAQNVAKDSTLYALAAVAGTALTSLPAQAQAPQPNYFDQNIRGCTEVVPPPGQNRVFPGDLIGHFYDGSCRDYGRPAQQPAYVEPPPVLYAPAPDYNPDAYVYGSPYYDSRSDCVRVVCFGNQGYKRSEQPSRAAPPPVQRGRQAPQKQPTQR